MLWTFGTRTWPISLKVNVLEMLSYQKWNIWASYNAKNLVICIYSVLDTFSVPYDWFQISCESFSSEQRLGFNSQFASGPATSG